MTVNVSVDLVNQNLINYLENKPCNKFMLVKQDILSETVKHFSSKIVKIFNEGNNILPVFFDYYYKVKRIDNEIKFSDSLFCTPHFIKMLQFEIKFHNVKMIYKTMSQKSFDHIMNASYDKLIDVKDTGDKNFNLYNKLLQIIELMTYGNYNFLNKMYEETINELNDNNGIIYILNLPKINYDVKMSLNTTNIVFKKYFHFKNKFYISDQNVHELVSQFNDLILFVKSLNPAFISYFSDIIKNKILFVEIYCQYMIERILAGHSIDKEKFIFEKFRKDPVYSKIGKVINQFYISRDINKYLIEHNREFENFNTTILPDHIYNHTNFVFENCNTTETQLQNYFSKYFDNYNNKFKNRKVSFHLFRGFCEMDLKENGKTLTVICNPLQALYIESFIGKQKFNVSKKLEKQLKQSLNEIIVDGKISIENKKINVIDKFNFWKDVIEKCVSNAVMEHEVVMKSNIISLLKHNQFHINRLKHELKDKLRDHFTFDDKLFNSVLDNMEKLMYIKYDGEMVILED